MRRDAWTGSISFSGRPPGWNSRIVCDWLFAGILFHKKYLVYPEVWRFMKMHPLIVVSHSLGWLAKLAIAAVVAGWLIA